jgi:hypothetical protein
VADFAYDAATYTATWILNQALPAGRWDVSLLDVEAAANYSLPPLPDGGLPVDDFQLDFRVLPGDGNQDGTVDVSDIQSVASNWLAAALLVDSSGDGTVDLSDIQILATNWLLSVNDDEDQQLAQASESLPYAAPADDQLPEDQKLLASFTPATALPGASPLPVTDAVSCPPHMLAVANHDPQKPGLLDLPAPVGFVDTLSVDAIFAADGDDEPEPEAWMAPLAWAALIDVPRR